MTDATPQSLALQRIRADVRAMHAYAVHDATGYLKMDAMENPFGLPPALQAALGQRLGQLALNRYPGTRQNDLKAALAAHALAPEGSALILGNGSDELIGLVQLACARRDASGPAKVLAPAPGFVMYAMCAQQHGLQYVGVDLDGEFQLREQAMLDAIAEHRPALTFLAYPNNPTATLWDEAVVQRIADAVAEVGGIVVMDEAYQPFASRSWIDRMRAEPARNGHVLLMRTLSKFGLAGVRLGYMIGPAALVHEIDKLRPPYNVSVLNCEAALFALEHAGVFAAQAAELRAARTDLLAALRAMPGVEKVWDSQANMVLVRVADSARAYEGMKACKILVKNVSTMHPSLANCLRLTVGSHADNAQMLAALQASL
ncbi:MULTISPECIES: pyridoxal phosphate-dependent aminotransferase [Comamonadaceae]|uniref:Histidinol-phosphate aminotransferase n=1 Tax=Alicycliphilus denitrificans (strain DSM 14773 / CIP 107495 / K601) TaxID=596154 RepID=F4G7U3_ALIDK|nr:MULTISPECIES: aminotransferase class I/II-fold pyridoxal phosphate-dependent enzyme [Comamonadaceae]AEB83246.1 Histidinol-phosphate aminotransferase [Alicycliphilus denitrificans K601]POR11052.1 histidinol-phosphate aminotransferase [Diaphorobacter sp. LR2014-1]